MMSQPGGSPADGTFLWLQRLARSLEDTAAGLRLSRTQERTLERLARALGPTAVPLCARRLIAGARAEADWAASLLVAAARNPIGRGRVVEELLAIARGPSDEAKLRALALLTELEAPLPDMTELGDLGALQDRSLRDLVDNLGSPADIARAADHLAFQLDGDELIELAEALIVTTEARARPLLAELIARDDLGERIRGELVRAMAPLDEPAAEVPAAAGAPVPARRRPGRGRGPGPQLPLCAGRPDGTWVVVAREPRPGVRPLRWRTLWATVDADGTLTAAEYADELTGGAVDRLIGNLEADGVPLAPLPLDAAADRIAAAARATLAAGRRLPRGYYLGRDLLGLRDEHAAGRPPPPDHSQVLLARAVDLCADGEAARARPLLARYVASRPDDPEGASDLGLCLLALGELDGACAQLGRAACLEPDNPIHQWNLAAACHRAGRSGGSYLALRAYLHRADRDPGADRRRGQAESLMAEYERFARLDFPAVAPVSLARADEHLHAARAHRSAGEQLAAVAALQRAVRLVPGHHVAWTELALALADSRPVRARRCLERALAARPDYEPAREAAERIPAVPARSQSAGYRPRAKGSSRRRTSLGRRSGPGA